MRRLSVGPNGCPFCEFGPVILKAGATVVFAYSFWLQYFRVSNPNGSNISVSVQDNNNPGVYVMPSAVMTPNAFITFNSEAGDPCFAGLTINCSADGIHVYFRGYYNPSCL